METTCYVRVTCPRKCALHVCTHTSLPTRSFSLTGSCRHCKKTSFSVTQDPRLTRNRGDNTCTMRHDRIFKWKSIWSSHRDIYTFRDSCPQLGMPPAGPASSWPSHSKHTYTLNTILSHIATLSTGSCAPGCPKDVA